VKFRVDSAGALTPPDKQLAWRDAVFARDLRCRPAGPGRLRHDPKLLVPAPAPPPLNRRDHFDCPHRAMPIVTISIALRAKSPAKQGSRQKTLTPNVDALHFGAFSSPGREGGTLFDQNCKRVCMLRLKMFEKIEPLPERAPTAERTVGPARMIVERALTPKPDRY
jgi:hypothetical protein